MTPIDILACHDASKGWVHFAIHGMPTNKDPPNFPCLGCASYLSLASLEAALAQPLVVSSQYLHPPKHKPFPLLTYNVNLNAY